MSLDEESVPLHSTIYQRLHHLLWYWKYDLTRWRFPSLQRSGDAQKPGGPWRSAREVH